MPPWTTLCDGCVAEAQVKQYINLNNPRPRHVPCIDTETNPSLTVRHARLTKQDASIQVQNPCLVV